jgi:hypothetical protein
MQTSKTLPVILIAFVFTFAFLKWETPKDSPAKISVPPQIKEIAPPIFVFSEKPASNVVSISKNEPPKESPVTTIQARLRDLLDDDDPSLREQRIAELENLLGGTNGLALLEQLPPELMNFALGLPSFQKWIADDPESAAGWMSARENISSARVSNLVRDWNGKNPGELQQYLASLPDGDWKQKTFTADANQIVSADPLAAIDLARQMNSSPQQAGILEQATARWAKTDFSAAENWASQIGQPQLREQLLAAAAVSLAENDPLQGAQNLLQSVQSENVLENSAAQIAGVLAEQNPALAINWILQFPENDAQQTALANLVGVWGSHDRAGLENWIAALPENSLRMEAQKFSEALPVKNFAP